MPNYRRVYVPGRMYFFTVVTHERRHFLTMPTARKCLREAFDETQQSHPFALDAICLLPDHLHCIWTLPEQASNYSRRWSKIKALFTRRFRDAGGPEGEVCASRQSKGEAGFWQRRFWEHCIRDDGDYYRHLDYIHYNPVKHGFVETPGEWEWSTFQRFVQRGWYDPGWGWREPGTIKDCVFE